jgi:hypothetical protein
MLSTAAMASPDLGEAQQQATNWHAIIMFVIFVGLLCSLPNGQQNKPQIPKTSIQQVAEFQVSKMVWRLRVTICPQRHSWYFRNGV